jgi:hypothetical protein
MFKADVRTDARNTGPEAGPEAVRLGKVSMAFALVENTIRTTYPDVITSEIIVPDTIAEIAQNSPDPIAASDAARASGAPLIQGAVQKPELN